jgi:hypothetical protein
MIYIYVIIIIIILAIDIYFKFTDPPETMVNVNEDKNMIKFDEPNPWTQIYVGNNINKYYLKINNIEKYKEKIHIDAWEQIPFIRKDLIINENDMLIIITNNEKEALVVANVLISYISGDLTLTDIIEKDLINTSLQKAQRYELVVNKLRELIKENLYKINRDDTIEKYVNKDSDIEFDTALVTPQEISINNLESSIDYSVKKKKNKKNKEKFVNKITESDIVTQITPVIEPTLPMFSVMPYEGSEFASINF